MCVIDGAIVVVSAELDEVVTVASCSAFSSATSVLCVVLEMDITALGVNCNGTRLRKLFSCKSVSSNSVVTATASGTEANGRILPSKTIVPLEFVVLVVAMAAAAVGAFLAIKNVSNSVLSL